MSIYRVLGVARDADETAVKRAYAARIKQYRPDTHPTEFAEVREAYEAALRNCRARLQWEAEGEEEQSREATEPVSPQGQDSAPAPATDYQPERIRAELPFEEGGEAHHPATPERITAADRSGERDETQRAAEAVAAMLAELEDQPQAREEEMLQRYRAHLDRVAGLPLDAQMDYEQGLRYWLLFSRHPSLAVFREAATRYDWEMRSVEIVRAYGSHAGLRYAAVKKLADLFAEARNARNPFLRIDGNDALLQYRIGDHYRALRAEELSTAWARACEGADLPQLVPRLQLTQGRASQVYWVDIAIGLFAGWVAWLLLTVKPTPYLWLEVALIGIPSVMLPAFIRGVVRRSRPVWRAAVARLQPLRGKVESDAGCGPVDFNPVANHGRAVDPGPRVQPLGPAAGRGICLCGVVFLSRAGPRRGGARRLRRAPRSLRPLAEDDAPCGAAIPRRPEAANGEQIGRAAGLLAQLAYLGVLVAVYLRHAVFGVCAGQALGMRHPSCVVQCGQRLALTGMEVAQNGHSLVLAGAGASAARRCMALIARISMNTANATMTKLIRLLRNIP